MKRYVLFALLLTLSACAGKRAGSGSAALPPTVLLISLDGFRHDYFE
jgi:predicted AlkP superfamily pyrophosphatase or phosphodiesterase